MAPSRYGTVFTPLSDLARSATPDTGARASQLSA